MGKYLKNQVISSDSMPLRLLGSLVESVSSVAWCNGECKKLAIAMVCKGKVIQLWPFISYNWL